MNNVKRVLLKLSGEALAGDKKTGFDEETVVGVAKQIKVLTEQGYGKTFLDKDSQNTAVTVLLICLTLYLCFIGISVVTFFVKAYLILRMSGDTLILYATYLLKCAKEKSSFESSQYIERAASIIKNSNLSGQTKDELLCEIESSDDV